MENSELGHYKSLLLAKRQELATGKSYVEAIPVASEPHGDPVDMAASETNASVLMRLRQSDSKLLWAIDDALARIRHEKFGVCEECGQPISKVRLEAVPWARYCKDCKEHRS